VRGAWAAYLTACTLRPQFAALLGTREGRVSYSPRADPRPGDVNLPGRTIVQAAVTGAMCVDVRE